MGGLLWSRWRSVRGIGVTHRLIEFRRWSHNGLAAMWRDHIEHSIAIDGSPMGIENAFRFESGRPDVVMLWSRWSDRAGAARLRELARDAPNDAWSELAGATHEAVWTVAAMQADRDQPPIARAIDLDVVHAVAEVSSDLADLAKRWPRVTIVAPVPSWSPVEKLEATDCRRLSELLAQRRSTCDERALLDHIERAPYEREPLQAYVDWLNARGRADEAAQLALRL